MLLHKLVSVQPSQSHYLITKFTLMNLLFCFSPFFFLVPGGVGGGGGGGIHVAFFLVIYLTQRKMCFLLFKFLHVQLLAGQHSILRDVWIMMGILLPLLQLMQLQQVAFLLGIGEKPLEMVTLQLNLTVL
jgi:hypothetical protein